MKKDLPDELYPGAPIAGAGSEAPTPQAEEDAPQKPTPEEEKAKAAKEINAAAIIFTILIFLIVFRLLNIIFTMDKEITQMLKEGKNIKKQLDFIFKFFYITSSACCIFPALFVRFVVIRKAICDALESFQGAPLCIFGFVLIVFLHYKAPLYFFVLILLSYTFTLHILSYDKGGLFRTFFVNIWYKVKSVFHKK